MISTIYKLLMRGVVLKGDRSVRYKRWVLSMWWQAKIYKWRSILPSKNYLFVIIQIYIAIKNLDLAQIDNRSVCMVTCLNREIPKSEDWEPTSSTPSFDLNTNDVLSCQNNNQKLVRADYIYLNFGKKTKGQTVIKWFVPFEEMISQQL